MDKFSSVVLFTFILILTGCSHLSNNNENEINSLKEENKKIKEEIEASNKKFTNTIKDLIREELLPEIQGLSYVPKDIRNKQMEAKTSVAQKVVLGRVEWVKIKTNGMRLKARVDTGAQTCSMHAENILEKIGRA